MLKGGPNALTRRPLKDGKAARVRLATIILELGAEGQSVRCRCLAQPNILNGSCYVRESPQE
jgi:hypothetical protein